MQIDRTEHDRRVTELLEANNREVERRRAAEARVRQLEAELQKAGDPNRVINAYMDGLGLHRGGFVKTNPDAGPAILQGTEDHLPKAVFDKLAKEAQA